ncbi:hypothetical protein [Microcoleus sp. Pol7_A1]
MGIANWEGGIWHWELGIGYVFPSYAWKVKVNSQQSTVNSQQLTN